MKKKLKSGINVLVKPLDVNETPVHIQLEPTTACNLACITCPHEDYIKRAKHLTLDEFIRVFDQIKPEKITLSGFGEPFSNPRLPDMVRYAKDRGASVNTTSNMTLINDKLAERIVECGLDLIKVSIDAARAETYKTIRGEDCHQKIVDGIRMITAIKKRKNINHPSIRFNFVVQGANFREMADLVDLAHEIGVEAIYFQPLELVGIEHLKEKIVGDMTREGLLSEFKRAYEEARKVDLETNLSTLVGSFETFWKKYEEVGTQKDSRICLLPWFSTYITVDGDVRPCCSFPINPEANMGNIFKEDFKDIWNGKKYRAFRKAIREGKRPYKICQNCVPRTLWDIVRYSRILPGFFQTSKVD